MGRTYVMLWLLTGELRFRRRAEMIARYFKTGLRPLGDAYDWPYWDVKPQESEDISHAAISVDFAFQCYRAGLVFDERDMKRFVGTLRRIYGGKAGYHEWINGTGDIGGKLSRQAGRWLRLGYLDSQVREDYARYLFAREEASLGNAEILGAAFLVETAAPLRFERPLPSLKEGKRYRTWRDQTGKHSTFASLEGVDGADVLLHKRDGSTVRVPLERLSEEDRQWVQFFEPSSEPTGDCCQ
jgi:hypothetical protein